MRCDIDLLEMYDYSCQSELNKQTYFRKYLYNDKQLKFWQPIEYVGTNRTLISEIQVSVDFFGKCRYKKALLGWRSVLKPSERQLLKQTLKRMFT